MIGVGIVTLANLVWLGLAALRLKRGGARREQVTPMMVKSHGTFSVMQVERGGANDA
jgi:hypothetical protein